MTQTVSHVGFQALANRLQPALAAVPAQLLRGHHLGQALAKPGELGVVANLVWSGQRPVEIDRQFGSGVGQDIVDFDRIYNLEVAAVAGNDDTTEADALCDRVIAAARAALIGTPGLDFTLGGACRYVSVGGAQDATDAFTGQARVTARLLPITLHLRAVGDPD